MTDWTEAEQRKVSALCAHAFACGMHSGILRKAERGKAEALKEARRMADDALRELVVPRALGEEADGGNRG